VLHVLLQHLQTQLQSFADGTVITMKSFQFARFALLTLMCYGEKLDEKTINDIEFANRSMIVYSKKLSVLVFLPAISNYIFHERVMTAIEMQQKQKELCVPLINVRKQHRMQQNDTKESYVCSYLDSFLNMKLPEEGERSLTEDEMVTLCPKFLNAGTDTTAITLPRNS